METVNQTVNGKYTDIDLEYLDEAMYFRNPLQAERRKLPYRGIHKIKVNKTLLISDLKKLTLEINTKYKDILSVSRNSPTLLSSELSKSLGRTSPASLRTIKEIVDAEPDKLIDFMGITILLKDILDLRLGQHHIQTIKNCLIKEDTTLADEKDYALISFILVPYKYIVVDNPEKEVLFEIQFLLKEFPKLENGVFDTKQQLELAEKVYSIVKDKCNTVLFYDYTLLAVTLNSSELVSLSKEISDAIEDIEKENPDFKFGYRQDVSQDWYENETALNLKTIKTNF